MAEGNFTSETRRLSRSIEQMSMNTPLEKKALKHGDQCQFNANESVFSTILSPPQTEDTKQKRERSDSLMLCQTNDMTATKRRVRSRSRLGLEPEDVPLSILSPPCSSKTREQALSRSESQNETLAKYGEPFFKHVAINLVETSVFMTPASDTREPLQTKDMNAHIDVVFEKPSNHGTEQLTTHLEDSSDSSNDEEACPRFVDKTRLRLNFDECISDQEVKNVRAKIIGERMGERKIDFVKELVNMNCEEICMEIFCRLEARDLQRIASVSKLWRKVCKKDRMASPRLDQFICGRRQHVIRKGKENLGCNTKFDCKVPQRPPFSAKDQNTVWTPCNHKSSARIEQLDNVKTNIMAAYERVKCPSCGSPSRKKANDLCECDRCDGIYCCLCQRRVDKNHKTGKCGIKLNKSKTSKGREAIGSKKSKDRLKRY